MDCLILAFMLRNNCHPRKVITYAIVYMHNRPGKACSTDRKKKENPAFTSGWNTMQSDRLPQIAFKPLHSSGWFFFWGRGGRGEGYGIGWKGGKKGRQFCSTARVTFTVVFTILIAAK